TSSILGASISVQEFLYNQTHQLLCRNPLVLTQVLARRRSSRFRLWVGSTGGKHIGYFAIVRSLSGLSHEMLSRINRGTGYSHPIRGTTSPVIGGVTAILYARTADSGQAH